MIEVNVNSRKESMVATLQWLYDGFEQSYQDTALLMKNAALFYIK